MSEVVEKLKAARARVEKPGSWIQGTYAQRFVENGEFGSERQDVDFDHPDAFCFCMLGALQIEEGDQSPELRVMESVLDRNVAAWNDQAGRTQKDVLDAFDRAIAIAEAAEASHA